MPRYFFHIRGASADVLDEDGRELPDLEGAKSFALEAVRDMLSQDIKGGTLDLRYRLDVEDEAHFLVHQLPFEDAFEAITR